MEKPRMTSPDFTAENIDRIAQLFPAVITESLDSGGKPMVAVDFDLLRQELSDHVIDGTQERYRLDWPGKRAAAFAANAAIAKTLRPSRDQSVEFETTKNLFVAGDNLDALKLLQEAYLGGVKLIYIDPPYNTGGDRFVYPDDYAQDNASYLAASGQADDVGRRLVTNVESNGRFHTDWLTMMYPRLRLARNLLSDDGVLFVSIDDHESAALKLMLDEVFGASNFLTTVVWEKVYSPMNSATQFASVHDYVHVYARNGADWASNLLPRTEEQDKLYKNPDDDPRGRWKAENATAAAGHATPSQFYELVTPAGRLFNPPPGRAWLYTKERYQEMVADGRVWFGQDGSSRPAIKRFLTDVKQGRVAETLWPYAEVGHNQEAKKELIARMHADSSDLVFSTPKPTRLVRRMLQLATSVDSEDVVLDFFAGSGTTGDAVMQQNAEDGGNRRFILVQLNEEVVPASAQFETLADFAVERLRRAGEAIGNGPASAADSTDVGFRVLSVDTTCWSDVLRSPDATTQQELVGLENSVRPERSDEDLLFQVLLDWGLEMTLPISVATIAGRDAFVVDDGALIAYFGDAVSPDLVQAVAEYEPLRAVFRDSAFGSDDARLNAEQIFKQLSPVTEIRAI